MATTCEIGITFYKFVKFAVGWLLFLIKIIAPNDWVYTKYPNNKLKNIIQTLIGYFVYTLLANVFNYGILQHI